MRPVRSPASMIDKVLESKNPSERIASGKVPPVRSTVSAGLSMPRLVPVSPSTTISSARAALMPPRTL